MENNNYHSLIEDLSEKGLLLGLSDTGHTPPAAVQVPANIFAAQTSPQEVKKVMPDVASQKSEIDGFDTDILGNLKYKQISDMKVRLKIKVARTKAELDELNKNIESSFLHADKSDYQKLLEQRKGLEKEISILTEEYRKHQIRGIIPNMISKMLSCLGINSNLK